MSKTAIHTGSRLYQIVADMQGDRPWGNFLDAGTGKGSLRWLLTRADTWKLADKHRLLRATQAAAGVLWHALNAPDLGFLKPTQRAAP